MTEQTALDLFGNPVSDTRRGRGRPSHVPTPESRNKVVLWLALGHDEGEIAAALGVCQRTLAKHYFHELRYRRTARMELAAMNLAAIVERVKAGSASAMALLARRIDRAAMEAEAGKRQVAPPKSESLGLKEQRRRAAQAVTGLFAPGDPPPTMQ